MSDHTPNDAPWPLWASRSYSRDELTTLLGVSVRTLRSAVKRGDVEMIQEERYHAASYRLRDCAWSRKYLSTIAPPPGATAHGEAGCNSSGVGAAVDKAEQVQIGKKGGAVAPPPGAMSSKTAPTSTAHVAAIERQAEHLAEQVETLRGELEDARRESREDAQRLEAAHAQLRDQLAALIALLAVLVEAQRQREATPPLNPLARFILALWSWLKMRLDGWRVRQG